MSERGVTIAGLRAATWLSLLLVVAMPAMAGELRDPLKPPTQRAQPTAEPTVNPADWRLASTLVADGRRVAVINGQIAAPGQTVDGARVLAVERGHVRLRVGSEEFTIRSSTHSIRSSHGEAPQ